ncbi:SIN-like family protein [Artemisia annua]|uniref:SIN-like family protein n=1 Tax=Artemisia annua TaxID=35608 RepID=A0A2U1PER9_ARTAN|nr:SIN-like family protein [Artemisia annua]
MHHNSLNSMDIDLHDLNIPSKAPPKKPSKFAPKNSKFKPLKKPKLEQPDELILSSVPNATTILVVPKVEIDDSKQTSVTVHGDNAGVNIDNGVNNNIEVGKVDEEGQEDEVVREIDVYFNSPVDDDSKLYVLQYPLRPSWRSYELEERCEQVRVKPETSEVEVEMSVQFDSKNYDDVDGDKAMSKQVLASTWQPQTSKGLTLGILMGNELHINPVHTVAQLRPSMQHLKLQQPAKTMNATHDDGMVASQWVPLKYRGETHQLSRGYLENMVVRKPSPIQFSMNGSDYIDSICSAPIDKRKPKVVPSQRVHENQEKAQLGGKHKRKL